MATETILKEVAVIDEAIAIICERLNLDRISDALLREVMDCTDNIKEALTHVASPVQRSDHSVRRSWVPAR